VIPGGPDVALRAIGVALASVSIAFACESLLYGDGKVHVRGMEYLAIFAQPRGAAIVDPPPPAAPAPPPSPSRAGMDMATTGSLAEIAVSPAHPLRPEIVAARADRVWLRIEGKIVAATPGDTVAGLGRIGGILLHDAVWTVIDDKGAPLLTLPNRANGVSMFSKKLIFD
jgi:hypothetical protein